MRTSDCARTVLEPSDTIGLKTVSCGGAPVTRGSRHRSVIVVVIEGHVSAGRRKSAQGKLLDLSNEGVLGSRRQPLFIARALLDPFVEFLE